MDSRGTYTVDASGNLTLTSADTGTVTRLPLGQMQLATGNTQSSLGPASLHPLGLIGDAGAGLVTGTTPLVNGKVPVASFQATGASGKTQTLTAAADLSVGVFGECGLDGALEAAPRQRDARARSRGASS